MLKHESREGSNNCWKTEKNVHFGDIKGALPRSSNDKKGCWKLKAKEKALRTCFLKTNVN